MKTSRLVTAVLVVLVCLALAFATSEVSAARASPKAALSHTSATASATWAHARAAAHSLCASGSQTVHQVCAWVRTAVSKCHRCTERVFGRVLQAAGAVWRTLAQKASGCVNLSRATIESCVSSATALAESLSAAATKVASSISAVVPDCVKPFTEDFLNGACSVVMVRHHFTTQAAGNIPESPSSRHDAVWSYTTAKFLYGLGAGMAELCLLRVLYREPHGNHRTNTWNRFVTSTIGWPLMVAAIAVPNGLVEAGMVLVLVLKLSPSSFRPAIVLGHLIRPYTVAALRTCPYLGRLYATYQALWPAKAATSDVSMAIAEVCLWAAVVWAILFLSSAMNKRCEDEEASLNSPSDDETEEGAAVTASKTRAKAAPSSTRRPRNSTRSSSRG